MKPNARLYSGPLQFRYTISLFLCYMSGPSRGLIAG